MSLGKYLEGAGVTGNYANTQSDAADAADDVGVRHGGRDAGLDRREPELRARLRSAEPGAQDLRASGGDLCGVVSNTSFGKNVLTNNFDPGILNGWGVRPSDWNLGAVDSAADWTHGPRWT